MKTDQPIQPRVDRTNATHSSLRLPSPGFMSKPRPLLAALMVVVLGLAAGLTLLLANEAGSLTQRDSQVTAQEGADLLASLSGDLPKLTAKRLENGFSVVDEERLDRAIAIGRKNDLLSGLVVTNNRGRIVYSKTDSSIGRHVTREPGLLAALDGTAGSSPETSRRGAVGSPTLDAYLPLRQGGGVIGALELQLPLDPISARANATQHTYLIAIGAAALLLCLLAMPLLNRFARLTAQSHQPGRRRDLRALRSGIKHGELEVFYQPQLDVMSGGLIGAEALVRWSRRGKLVLPGAFLPLAESCDLIGALTDSVLDKAISEASSWPNEGVPLTIAVNVSARDLHDLNLVDRVARTLAQHSFPPERLRIEITETAVIRDEKRATQVLESIADLGIEVSLDDFGTGYSSLTRLSQLPIAEVKIDRSFLSRDTPHNEALVEGIIRLAHSLGARVLAEGVEDEQGLRLLRRLNCELAQGFLFSRPLPADEFRRWAADREVSEHMPFAIV